MDEKQIFLKNQLFKVFIVIIIVLSVSYIYWDVLRSALSPVKEQGTEQKQEKKTALSGLEVAQRNALFLNRTMQTDGSFIPLYECRFATKECIPGESSNPPHAGQVILAYYELGKITGDNAYKEKAQKSLNFALDKCLKNKDNRYCEWHFFAFYELYKDTKDKKYLTAMLAVANDFLKEEPLADLVNNNAGVKLTMLYEMTGEDKYKKALDKMAQSVLAGRLKSKLFYQDGNFNVYNHSIQAVWSVYVPAYMATRDKTYLKAAQDFFDKARIVKHINEFNTAAENANLIKAADALLSLASLDEGGAEKHKDKAHRILQRIIGTLWDNPERQKFNGDDGFLQIVMGKNAKVKDNSKATLFNGWISRQFLRMPDDQFAL